MVIIFGVNGTKSIHATHKNNIFSMLDKAILEIGNNQRKPRKGYSKNISRDNGKYI